MKINRSTIIQWLKIILPILLMLFAVHELSKIIKEANAGAIADQLGAVDVRTLLLIAILPLFLAFPMFFYDYFIVKKLKIKIALKSLMKQSLIINSFSNLIGFGGLVGVLLRAHYFKRAEMDNGTFFKTIASVTLFYLAGISLFADFLVLFYWDLKLFQDHPFLLVVASFIGLYTPFLFIKGLIQWIAKKATLKQLFGELLLVVVSVVEWLGAFTMLFILTKLLHINISVVDLWPIFIISSAAGIVSMIPGGLGSFDLVFIWGGTSLGIPSESILILLLFYRVGYYIIPFFAGLILFGRDIWRSFNRGYNSIPNVLLEKLTHIIATLLVFLAGMTLLISSAAPGAIENIRYVREIMALPFINVSHQVAVITGFLLLALSNGISYKDRRSYKATLFVLLFASVLFILKGVQYQQALFMLFVALLLYLSKNRFYRRSYVETWGRRVFNTLIVALIISSYVILAFLSHEESLSGLPFNLEKLLLPDTHDLIKSAVIGLIVITLVVIVDIWMRKKMQFKKKGVIEQQSEIRRHMNHYGGEEAFLCVEQEELSVYWNSKKTVLFAYRVSADKLIVLGDLIGDKAHFKEAVEEFIDFADEYGYTPVFYEVSDGFIPYLYGYGYNFFRLGEDGYIGVDHFKNLTYEKDYFSDLDESMSKQGYYYEQLYAPFSLEFVKQLAILSDKWQNDGEHKDEAHFFDTYYLNRGPIALIRNKEGKIVVFAKLLPLQDEKKTLVLSLLRSHVSEFPAQTIDYLFFRILNSAKEANYSRLNLGMTYLKHVGISKYAGISEKVAAQILVDSQEQTAQQDLQRLKERYANEWQPKYIAYRKKVFLPITMIQIMMLLGNNKLSNKYNQFKAMRSLKK